MLGFACVCLRFACDLRLLGLLGFALVCLGVFGFAWGLRVFACVFVGLDWLCLDIAWVSLGLLEFARCLPVLV